MKKIYTLLAAMAVLLPLGSTAQDTLRRWDLVGAEGVQAPGAFGWGYQYGHGANGIKEIAEKYYFKETHYILGVMVLFDDIAGGGASSDDEAFAGIYDVSGRGAPKATANTTATIKMKDLSIGQFDPTFITFSERVEVKDTIYVSIGYPEYEFVQSNPNFTPPNDTLGVYSTFTRALDDDPDVYWKNAVRYKADNWENPAYLFNDKVNFCIAPIVTTEAPKDTTSIRDIDIISGLKVNKIYPNPVIDQVNVSMNLESNGFVNIAFHDLSGRRLGLNQFDLAAGEHNLVLDVENTEKADQMFMTITTERGAFSVMLQTK